MGKKVQHAGRRGRAQGRGGARSAAAQSSITTRRTMRSEATVKSAPPCATAASPARADHSRFVQRVRRRYAAELTLLAPGLPDRAMIEALIDTLLHDGRELPAALRVARQLVLERLAVLDIEQRRGDGRRDRDDDRAGRGHARARARAGAGRAGRALRRAAQRGRRTHRVLGRRHGQARRARAQRLVRHRPDLRLRGRRHDRRRPAGQRARILLAGRAPPLRADRRDDRRRLRVPRRPGAAAERQLRAAGRQPGDARGIPAGAGPRVGTLRVAEEPRRRAAAQRAQRPRARAARVGHAVRLPPLPRLRRLRRPAPAAREGARRGAAPRRRPARARQRRQAVARRHPRDRVHRAAAAGGARRPVPGDPHALDAEGAWRSWPAAG